MSDKYPEVWTSKHSRAPSKKPLGGKVLFFKTFLLEFGILCVVYMLNGIQMYCHSQRCPLSEGGGLTSEQFSSVPQRETDEPV